MLPLKCLLVDRRTVPPAWCSVTRVGIILKDRRNKICFKTTLNIYKLFGWLIKTILLKKNYYGYILGIWRKDWATFFSKNLVTLALRVYAAKQCIFHLSGILWSFVRSSALSQSSQCTRKRSTRSTSWCHASASAKFFFLKFCFCVFKWWQQLQNLAWNDPMIEKQEGNFIECFK